MDDRRRRGNGDRGGRGKSRRRALVPWIAAGLTLLSWSIFARPRPLLLWNASSSSAIGLYAVTSATGVRAGDTVIAWAPARDRRLAAIRRYVPYHVPLVKSVAAVAGDRVCGKRDRLLVNGRSRAVRRSSDPSGRPMPWWLGCRRLDRGEVLLLSGDALAFDGRYFGPTSASELVGRARLLWTPSGNWIHGLARG